MTSAAPRGIKRRRCNSPNFRKGAFAILLQPTINMKKFTKKTRILAVVTLLLLTMAVLAGCGGSKVKTLTVNESAFQIEDAATLESLSRKPSELKAVASMLATVYGTENGYDPQAKLIAATRGYDLTVESGNEAGKEYPNVGLNLEAAKNVLREANTKAAEKGIDAAWIDSLNAADVTVLVKALQTAPATEKDTGFIAVLLTAIGKALNWITDVLCFDSYLLGICLFAIVVEIAMLPFAIKQQKNSIRQASLRPKEMAIRNKYKGRNDQKTMQKMQQEIQEFYQRENFSPYSGCLQLFLQLPIIMALYQIIIDPLHYVLGQSAQMSSVLATYAGTCRAAGGLGMTLSAQNSGSISLLSKLTEGSLNGLNDFAFFSNGEQIFQALDGVMERLPNFSLWGLDLGISPSFEGNYILLLVPVLTFVTYFITSKLNRKLMYQPATNGGTEDRQVACSNSMMDITMPAMSTFFTFMVPALVGIYWMFRSLVSLFKQFIIAKLMPLPTFTEEDYKAAAKEMAGKKVVKKSENAGKVRSLHHIDDEDFDDTREQALARKAAIEEREREEQQKKAEKAEKLPFGMATLKQDDRKSRKDENKTDATQSDHDAEPTAQEADEAPTERSEQ